MLINAPVRQAGVSTMTKALSFTYSNWINRPVLMVSIKSDSFYKHKCNVSEEFNSKFLSIVNGNTGGNHGDLINYTYKINDLLYYYQAHSSPAASRAQHEMDLQIFLERASREFGMVIVDLDDHINSFRKFLDIADAVFTVVPPDTMVLSEAQEAISDVIEGYREAGGLAVKTKMLYIANKLDGDLSKSTVCKILKVGQREVFDVPYDKRFLKESNNNRLAAFLADTLLYEKTPQDKVLSIRFKRIYESLRSL